MDEYACAFCGWEVEEADRLIATAWIDPHGVACVAHYWPCVSQFDGLPSWPRVRRGVFRWLP